MITGRSAPASSAAASSIPAAGCASGALAAAGTSNSASLKMTSIG